MGIRCFTHIHEMESLGGEVVCTFYCAHGGAPDEHGKYLADWLTGKRLVNGIERDFQAGRDHNRAGQMAIDLMASIKKKTSCEVFPTGSSGMGEDFVYHIFFSDGGFSLFCEDCYSRTNFMMAVDEYDAEQVKSALSVKK